MRARIRKLSAKVRKDLRGVEGANPIKATRSDEVNRSARRKFSAREQHPAAKYLRDTHDAIRNTKSSVHRTSYTVRRTKTCDMGLGHWRLW